MRSRSKPKAAALHLVAAYVFIGWACTLLTAQAQEHPQMTPEALARDAMNFRNCIAQLWPKAQARGVSRGVFDRELGKIQPDLPIIDLMREQPEFEKPLWSYVDNLVSADRIAKGRQLAAKYAAIWPAMEQRFGVDRYTLVALWAVESNFGKSIGGRPVIRSTATLACIGRRQDYFENELLAALDIVQHGDVPSSHLRGSWAGAFGHTQFMPSTFKPYAVDFDGDGKKNLVDSVADALASTANNLKLDGWEAGKTWGYEVRVPQGFDLSVIGKNLNLGQLEAMGLRRVNGQGFPRKDDVGALTLPAGLRGPHFVLMKNFQAIKRYNGSEAYAYAVGNLADRIRGGGPFVGAWPRDMRPLNREERQELQARLTQAGFDTGGTEGRIGPKTREAVGAFQLSIGAPPDGFATPDLLERLRRERW